MDYQNSYVCSCREALYILRLCSDCSKMDGSISHNVDSALTEPTMLKTVALAFLAIILTAGQTARALSSLEFLILPPDAVTSARGQTGIAWEERLEGLLLNPANLPAIGKDVSVSWGRQIAGINQFQVAATLSDYTGFPLAIGINSLHYGQLDGYDQFGNETGSFTAQEIMLYGSSAFSWHQLDMGATGRLIYSGIENYTLTALALDLGSRYSFGDSGWNLGLVLQNAGFILSEYSSTSKTELPMRLRAGLAKRLNHLPLRWFVDYTLLGETEGALHLGGDFYLPIGWTLRSGYLFEQGSDRLESLDEAMRGMTFGFGGKIVDSWLFDYSYTTLGVLGSVNHVTFTRRF
jgi:hypothetical protein